jgi:glutathione S-transferase
MLTLYHVPISFNSRRVWVALLEKGLEFTLKQMKLDGDQFQPEFLALNPFHHIPVLVDEGVTVFESLAILDYLEAKYPQPPLLPQEPQELAKVKMVEMVTVNELVPALPLLIRHSFGLTQAQEKDLEASKQKAATALKYFEQLLPQDNFFLEDRLSLAEVVLGTVTPVLPGIGVSLHDYPRLSQWTKKLMERESWQKTQATPEQIEAFKAAMQKLLARNN